MRVAWFKSNKGFTIVEALLAGSIFVLVAATVIGAVVYAQDSIITSGQANRASLLAEEGIEAVRNIRDQNFANLADGVYGLAKSGNTWTLVATPDVTEIFTRTITITSTSPTVKQVVSEITWRKNRQRTGDIAILANLTDWQSQQYWITPSRGTCLNISGGQDALKIDLQGNYAHLVTNSASASFVDVNVSNPDVPVQGGALSLQNNPKNIAVSGNYAYVASQNNSQELQIIDLTSPTSPTLKSSFDAPGNGTGNGVAVVGTTAYIVRDNGTEELHIFNVSNPGTPVQRSQLDLGSSANEIYVTGNYAFIASAGDAHELQIVNVTNPAAPVLTKNYDLSGTADATTITGYGQYVLIGRTTGEVDLIDISSPTVPSVVSTFAAGAQVNDIDVGVNNTRAFLATTNSTKEFQVINLTIPTSLTLLGSYDAPGALNGVKYSATQNITYVVGSSNSGNFCAIKPQ